MEDLTKQQIVLLTLFTSFVTSIATGIFTVTLMGQAPAGVTQTINQVVERTIERVVTAEPTPTAVAKAPVVITVEDQTAVATQKAVKSMVRIMRQLRNSTGEIFEGYGVIVDGKLGRVVTDKSVTAVAGDYSIILADGTRYQAVVTPATQGSDISFLNPIATTSLQFSPVVFGTGNLKLGQTAILIGGAQEVSVRQGIIESLDRAPGTASTTQAARQFSTISFATGGRTIGMGSSLFNLAGEFIGMKTQSSSNSVPGAAEEGFLPAQMIKASIDNH